MRSGAAARQGYSCSADAHGSGEINGVRDGVVVDQDRSYADRCAAIERATRLLFADAQPGA